MRDDMLQKGRDTIVETVVETAFDTLKTKGACRMQLPLFPASLQVPETSSTGDPHRVTMATVLALTKERDFLKLTCEKQKDAAPFDAIRVQLVTVLNGATCVATLLSGTRSRVADFTPVRLAALDVLKRIYTLKAPVTRNQWFHALSPKTITERLFYDVVNALPRVGLVERDGKKRIRPR
jgi:hypothetical protein